MRFSKQEYWSWLPCLPPWSQSCLHTKASRLVNTWWCWEIYTSGERMEAWSPFCHTFPYASFQPGFSWVVYIIINGEKKSVNSESCTVVSDSLRPNGLLPGQLLFPWNSPGKNNGVGCHSLIQGSSQPRDQTEVSCTAGRVFTNWATKITASKMLPWVLWAVLANYQTWGGGNHNL